MKASKVCEVGGKGAKPKSDLHSLLSSQGSSQFKNVSAEARKQRRYEVCVTMAGDILPLGSHDLVRETEVGQEVRWKPGLGEYVNSFLMHSRRTDSRKLPWGGGMW